MNLINPTLVKGLQIIEEIRKAEFVSCEIFSDGSGHILDDNANKVLEWDDLNKLEEIITDFINKKGRKL